MLLNLAINKLVLADDLKKARDEINNGEFSINNSTSNKPKIYIKKK